MMMFSISHSIPSIAILIHSPAANAHSTLVTQVQRPISLIVPLRIDLILLFLSLHPQLRQLGSAIVSKRTRSRYIIIHLLWIDWINCGNYRRSGREEEKKQPQKFTKVLDCSAVAWYFILNVDLSPIVAKI